MEQFVLGIFQEHLSKFIVGFRKEQVNANLLNGKGEITGIELNCSFLNEEIRKVTPYIELESAHISKLSFHVSSWTNVRQSPIVIDVEHATAVIMEPLHFDANRKERARIRQLTRTELAQLIQQGIYKPRTRTSSYNLLDRILDNLTVEIQSVSVTFQPAGKFKTRRRAGPWTPPAVRLQLFGIRLVSVNEYGQEASPDEVWRHNHHHHRRRGDGSFLIYKKLETEYQISIVVTKKKARTAAASAADHDQASCSTGADKSFGEKIPSEKNSEARNNDAGEVELATAGAPPPTGARLLTEVKDDDEQEIDEEVVVVIPIVSSSPKGGGPCTNNRKKVEVQFATQRRISDGEYLAIQVDATVPVVEIELAASTIPELAHLAAAMTYCLAKDRAFVDPLRSHSSSYNSPQQQKQQQAAPVVVHNTVAQSTLGESLITSVEEAPSADVLAALALEDGLSESSDEEDEVDAGDEVVKESEDGVANNDGDTSVVQNDGDANEVITTEQAPLNDENAESTATADATMTKEKVDVKSGASIAPAKSLKQPAPANPQKAKLAAATTSESKSGSDRPFLVLPNGFIFHDKISISVSVHHVTIRGTYTKSVDGHIQIVAKGVVAEAIWPTVTKEKGGYLQASVSYISIQEQHAHRIRPLLVGGAQYDNTGPVEQPAKPLSEVGRDETFPLYENRSVRPDPVGLRHTFPGQAFGLKMTVNLRQRLAAGTSDSPEEEIMVMNEVGVDQFDIVLDSGAWCRVLRFALNVEGGGFDPRWHSGDYSEYLTTDMLLHPKVPLNLEDCLQPTKQFFLDENDFLSSDLFNATVRITNVALRLPAAISEDLRSCDILVRSKEAMLTISSALPRTLMSGDDAAQSVSIEFPNDPSDVIYTLEKAEDPSNRQRGVMTSKAMSTFRFQLTFRGLSLQLAPVIPFHDSLEPQQLLLPAEMTLIFCFEGEPPELSSESNLTRMVIFASILAHRFEFNVDFDLIAAAAITLVVHLDNVLRTAADCSEIFDAQPDATSSNTASEGKSAKKRIRNSLQGRRVMVRRQITRSRETGGLSVACRLNAAETRVCIWRQNVPRKYPLRSKSEDNGEFAPSLRLLDWSLTGIDLGIEATHFKETRRLLLKLVVVDVCLKICDFGRLLEAESAWVKTAHDRAAPHPVGEWPMAKIFTCGSEDSERRAFAIRVEEVVDNTRAWALSAEFSDGVLDCRVDELETFALLVFDALLMPSSARTRVFGENRKRRIFPRNTVGDLFSWLLPDPPSHGIALPLETEEAPDLNEPVGSFSGKKIDRVLKSLMAKAMPSAVDILLLRVSMSGVLVRIPTYRATSSLSDSDGLGIKLWASDFLASYFASDALEPVSILDVLALKQEKWSAMVPSRNKGLRHGLKSRQSFLFTTSSIRHGDGNQFEEDLVEPFDFCYSYGDSKVSVLMSDDLSIRNVDKLEDFLVSILYFSDRCKEIAAHNAWILNTFVSRVRGNGRDAENSKPQENPISLACLSAVASLRSVKTWFRKMNEILGAYDKWSQSQLAAKDKEIADLRLLVFWKEKERLAALALVSSEATGWLRLGTAQRSGQRGLMSCMLWPHWAVLRRSFLILYAGPGQFGVVDIISLVGASLRELSGGQRKRDLKRAFAIVEHTGTVHFVIVGNDAEYITWVLGIQLAIRLYSSKKPESSSIGVVQRTSSLDSSSHSKRNGAPSDDANRLQSSNHGRPLGRSIARVVQAAKAKGQAVAVRGMRGPESKDTVQTLDDEASVNGSITDAISNSTRERNKDAVSTGGAAHLGTDPRRQQIRIRFAGVGQATKSRFGSALSAARQKGKEVAQRRRSGTDGVSCEASTAPSSITEDANTLSTKETWACSSCTFINTGDGMKCQVCESERSKGDCYEEDQTHMAESQNCQQLQVATLEGELAIEAKVDETEEVAFENALSGDQNERGMSSFAEDEERSRDRDDVEGLSVGDQSVTSDLMDDEDFDEPERRIGMKQRLGAAVRRARTVTSDSQKFLAGRHSARQETSEVTPLGSPNAVKLQKVLLSGPLQTPVHPFGEGGTEIPGVPLKKFEGLMSVRVGIHSTVERENCNTKMRDPKISGTAVGSPLQFTSGNEMGAESTMAHETSCEICDVEKTDEVEDRSGISDAGSSENDGMMELPFADPRPKSSENLEIVFRIQVFQHECDDATSSIADLLKKLPDIVALHTSLSESVARVPSYLFDSELDIGRTSMARMNENLSHVLGLTPLDSMRLTGKLLGGLLDVSQRANSNALMHSNYYAECVSLFLNSIVNVPLPIDGLAALADFLNLSHASTNNSTVERDHLAPTNLHHCTAADTQSNSFTVNAAEIFSLSSLCETELRRAENQSALAERLSKSSNNSNFHARDFPAVNTTPTFPAPISQPSASSQFSNAMHSALMKVMEERDEAHARMVSTEVLHVHEMEQQRKKTAHLSSQLEAAKKHGGATGTKLRDEKERKEAATLQRYEKGLQQDSDAELLSLGQQLAGEISARTSASLEVIRLKENRKIEQEHEAAEKQALRDEVTQLKQQLAQQRRSAELARQESGSWRESFEEVVLIREVGTPASLEAHDLSKNVQCCSSNSSTEDD